MMSDIVTERAASILRIQLNRPDKKNAMLASMYSTVAELLERAVKDDEIRVALLHGAGDSFTAGNDLADFVKNPPGSGDSPQTRLIAALIDFDKPIVAAVHGAAVGLGTTILPHCDIVYAGESAKFQMPFVNLGVVPEFCSTYTLPALIGHVRAAELMLLGSHFDAERALGLGLINQVVPDAELLPKARATAAMLAEKPIGALRATKKLMKHLSRARLERSSRAEAAEFSARVVGPDFKEAMTAFFEKRPPHFAGSAGQMVTH
jgi:enoyl-CoA hydratase/carnithine racemase